MLDMGSSLYNISYHPILDNYPEYDNIPRTTFNEALKFNFAWLIDFRMIARFALRMAQWCGFGFLIYVYI